MRTEPSEAFWCPPSSSLSKTCRRLVLWSLPEKTVFVTLWNFCTFQMPWRDGYSPSQFSKVFASFSELKFFSIEVFVGTFNANARAPNESFTDWWEQAEWGNISCLCRLLVDSEPDIYVVGCQEVVGLNPINVGILPNHSSQWSVHCKKRQKASCCRWEDKILDALDRQYVLLVSEQLVIFLL